MKSLISLICILTAFSTAQAQQRPVDRIGQLERLVYDLEERVYQLELESGRPTPRPPRPAPGPRKKFCSITDSGFSKTYLGEGLTLIDAEFNAKKSCENSVHPSHCQVRPSCDEESFRPAQSVCVITDSGFNRNYRGEGRTPVEATALARIACQKSVHASHCSSVRARCETVELR